MPISLTKKLVLLNRELPLILGPQPKSAESIFEKTAKHHQAPIIRVPLDLKIKEHSLNGQLFDFDSYSNLSISLAGPYQPFNAATAVTAVQNLKLNQKLSSMAIRKGLAEIKLMGRFQVVSLENRSQSFADQVILDGAHTPDSIEALFQNIARLFDNPKLIVVASLMQDKQITSIGRYICRFADLVITTQPFNNQRVTSGANASRKLEGVWD